MNMDRVLFTLFVVLAAAMFSAAPPVKAQGGWNASTATYYGGANASGTMGGACGYGDLYVQGYGVNTAALSAALFNNGASCGQCYLITCDYAKSPQACKLGAAVTVTATNFCPPDWSLPSDNGGWCNPPRQHFDMSQPAWAVIGVYPATIIPVLYQRVKCWKSSGVRFTINGFNYFELVLVTNVAGSGSIQAMSVKGSSTGWIQMTRNWGANWQCNFGLVGQSLSFSLTSTGGQSIDFLDIVPAGWQFNQTFTTNKNFDY